MKKESLSTQHSEKREMDESLFTIEDVLEALDTGLFDNIEVPQTENLSNNINNLNI